jgi:anti-sigma regulatory factor (Ser/Thr protein kinase)
MRAELRLKIWNDLGELARVNELATRLLEQHRATDTVVYATQLALEEALSNVIRHGFEDSAPHEIAIELHVAGDDVEIEIEDDGRDFDPLKAPPPDLQVSLAERRVGGLGVHLLRAFVREIRYERRGDRNCLWLRI